ncbi:MAG: hypothetical protein R3A47_02250 [Polyangiales bacterium]
MLFAEEEIGSTLSTIQNQADEAIELLPFVERKEDPKTVFAVRKLGEREEVIDEKRRMKFTKAATAAELTKCIAAIECHA